MHQIRRIYRSRDLRKAGKIPRDVYEFGWEIAKTKPEHWIVERVAFWMFAYDRHHKWCKQDFLYEVNDDAYSKAKVVKKERKIKGSKYYKEKDRRVRPPVIELTPWDQCSPIPEDLLKAFNEKYSQDK